MVDSLVHIGKGCYINLRYVSAIWEKQGLVQIIFADGSDHPLALSPDQSVIFRKSLVALLEQRRGTEK